jgi:hypothetical protein
MTKHESRLVSRWAAHQRRGKVVFVLSRGIAPPVLGIFIGVLAYDLISQRHSVHWGGAIFMSVVAATAGGIRATRLWDKIESIYAESGQQ